MPACCNQWLQLDCFLLSPALGCLSLCPCYWDLPVLHLAMDLTQFLTRGKWVFQFWLTWKSVTQLHARVLMWSLVRELQESNTDQHQPDLANRRTQWVTGNNYLVQEQKSSLFPIKFPPKGCRLAGLDFLAERTFYCSKSFFLLGCVLMKRVNPHGSPVKASILLS